MLQKIRDTAGYVVLEVSCWLLLLLLLVVVGVLVVGVLVVGVLVVGRYLVFVILSCSFSFQHPYL